MALGILGLKPVAEGLKIDPCIPSNWKEFTAVRRFRGSEIHLKVINPEGRNKGLRRLTVNGQLMEDGVVRVPAEGGRLDVVAEL
jgi:cellobiose phosphorylase